MKSSSATNAKQITMPAKAALETGGKGSGGVTSKAMKMMGRNLARVKNQKGGK